MIHKPQIKIISNKEADIFEQLVNEYISDIPLGFAVLNLAFFQKDEMYVSVITIIRMSPIRP